MAEVAGRRDVRIEHQDQTAKAPQQHVLVRLQAIEKSFHNDNGRRQQCDVDFYGRVE
jgi:hypothetical protein